MALIQHATEADIPAMVALGKQFCAIHPLAMQVGYDAESLRQTLWQLIHDEDSCVFVAHDHAQLAGGILGTITPLFFHRQARAASELAWFVAKPYRRSGVAKQLFDAFEAWAQAAHVQAVLFSALPLSGSLDGFYRRQGYQPYETQYFAGGS